MVAVQYAPQGIRCNCVLPGLMRTPMVEHALADHDHVLIGRAGGVERDFHLMAEELEKALARAAEGKGDSGRGRRPQRGNRGRKPEGGRRA